MKIQYWQVRSKVVLAASIFVACLTGGCSKSSPDTEKSESKNEVVINISSKNQTIRNFGASDAWTCQYVGLWPDVKKNQVADWLFSQEEDERKIANNGFMMNPATHIEGFIKPVFTRRFPLRLNSDLFPWDFGLRFNSVF